jgi:general secretion pathway protein J
MDLKYSEFHKSSQNGVLLSGSFGFTLLELMISLTILGLILLVVFGALHIGVRAWEKGEKDVDKHQRERVVLDLVKAQIASASAAEITGKKADQFRFKGEAESMAFVSDLSIIPSNKSGMVYVKYIIQPADGGKGHRLMVYEKNLAFIDKDKKMENLDESEFFDLIPAAKDIRFEYLQYPEDEQESPEWQESWDPEKVQGSPFAVRLILQQDEMDSSLTVIARIEAVEQ